jgi:hypothetical protein
LNARFSRPDAWINLDPIHQILHVPSIVVSEPGGQLTPYRTIERALRVLLVESPRRLGSALESQVGRPGGLISDEFNTDCRDVTALVDVFHGMLAAHGITPEADRLPALTGCGNVPHTKEVRVPGWSHIFDGEGEQRLSF